MYPSFDSIIETLNAGKTYSFPGGVHPDDKKALSNSSPIKKPAIPEYLTIPLRQHIGSDGICCVNVGDTVLKGQILSQSSTPFSVPVHAPTSGEVIAIAPHVVAHPSGLTEMCVTIKPDGKDTWCELSPIANYTDKSKNTLIEAICQAGISGMGGAGFPSHIKAASSKPVEFLIVNGIECEPYITSDDRLMREHAWQIRQGLDILTHLISPEAVIVAIEDNKPEALEALNIACQDKQVYRVISVETKYPAGGEKQLIQVLTGREVPRNGLPADVGMMMFNVGTCYAIADAILHGKPLIDRVVTVTGEAVDAPANFRAMLGTPVSHLLNEAGYNLNKQTSPKVIMGGPMMGFTLSSTSIPVVKTTNCLLVPATKELVDDNAERPCIRCSACADACPASLLPQQIFWHAKAKEYDKAEEYDLFDCIECGACAYVCPSEIPLVHYYRQAKSEIRLQRDEKNKAEKAKQRFEARKARLEREKFEREEKHRKAKEARLAANKAKEQISQTSHENSSVPPSDAKDKVAAALARAKAKKAALQANATTESSVEINENATQNGNETSLAPSPVNNDKKAQVAAAIARAKAKKAAQSKGNTLSAEQNKEVLSTDDSKKAKVAAAIARAKAKKAQQEQANQNTQEQPEMTDKETSDSTHTPNDKKARIAAAVAKAKAKKAAEANDVQIESPTLGSDKREDADKKKARIAAAVAKAKAQKAATVSVPIEPARHDDSVHESKNETDNSASETDRKKARIAAAVAKAKAKKLAQSVAQGLPVEAVEETNSAKPDNDDAAKKKTRIAAAVAKAKAKKAAAEKENKPE